MNKNIGPSLRGIVQSALPSMVQNAIQIAVFTICATVLRVTNIGSDVGVLICVAGAASSALALTITSVILALTDGEGGAGGDQGGSSGGEGGQSSKGSKNGSHEEEVNEVEIVA